MKKKFFVQSLKIVMKTVKILLSRPVKIRQKQRALEWEIGQNFVLPAWNFNYASARISGDFVDESNVLEYFEAFFNIDIMEYTVSDTNCYTNNCIESQSMSEFSTKHHWLNCTQNDSYMLFFICGELFLRLFVQVKWLI